MCRVEQTGFCWGVDQFEVRSVQQRDGLKVVDLTEDGVKVGFAGKPGHGVV